MLMKPLARTHNPFFWVATFLVTLLFLAGRPVQGQSLYADPKANKPGDMLTIVLAERTAAQRESQYDNRTKSRIGGAAEVSGGTTVSGKFGVDATFNSQTSNRNETVQSDLLQGMITATVTGVDSAGNLIILGERKLNVNGVTHMMMVSGTVRPFDIRHNNTILSYQIANAHIEYRQDGVLPEFFKPGTLVKIGGIAVLAAAAIFAVK